MSYKNNVLPIGKLLQNAGLISKEQLEIALGVQSQHAQMRLGEILALQEVIEVQTIDFFVDNLQKNRQKGDFPIGYYFKQAYLLNDEQIEIILTEQKNNQLKFGDIAVRRGWLRQATVDFFLNELTVNSFVLMSLIDLEEYNHEFLHLEKKYSNSSLILSRILAWTGGNSILSKNICNAFYNSNLNIPAGMEVSAVDKFIEISVIKNWQNTDSGRYVRYIEKSWLNNKNCQPNLLLSEYQRILLSNRVAYKQTKEQEELLNLGLIVEDNNYLRITNLIFQQIFDRNWLIEHQQRLATALEEQSVGIIQAEEPKRLSSNKDIATASIVKANNKNSIKEPNEYEPKPEITEIVTKFSSLFTLAGIVLFIPLVFVINNYSSSLRQQRKLIWEDTSQANKLKQFCNELNLADSLSAIKLISQIEKSKESILRSFPDTLEGFPDNCETALNKLRILAAPQLGKESRVLEAIKHLCQIPADAENINEAKIWLEHWYNSPGWEQKTKSYLNLIDECPASK